MNVEKFNYCVTIRSWNKIRKVEVETDREGTFWALEALRKKMKKEGTPIYKALSIRKIKKRNKIRESVDK